MTRIRGKEIRRRRQRKKRLKKLKEQLKQAKTVEERELLIERIRRRSPFFEPPKK
jgi:hypothetical protein